MEERKKKKKKEKFAVVPLKIFEKMLYQVNTKPMNLFLPHLSSQVQQVH